MSYRAGNRWDIVLVHFERDVTVPLQLKMKDNHKTFAWNCLDFLKFQNKENRLKFQNRFSTKNEKMLCF